MCVCGQTATHGMRTVDIAQPARRQKVPQAMSAPRIESTRPRPPEGYCRASPSLQLSPPRATSALGIA
eukprot:3139916-Rhodomonas_salina.2